MFVSNCITLTKDSEVRVAERGRSAIFRNPEQHPFRKVQIDGCVITTGLRADWLVEKENVGAILVELKGKDVVHACKQLEATLVYLKKQNITYPAMACLIVCQEYPRQRQKQLNYFREKFGLKIKICSTKRYECRIEDLI